MTTRPPCRPCAIAAVISSVVMVAFVVALALGVLVSCAPVSCLYSHDHNRCGF